MNSDHMILLAVGGAAAYFVWKHYQAGTATATTPATTTTTMPATVSDSTPSVTSITQQGITPAAQQQQLPAIQAAFQAKEKAAFGTDPALSGDASNPTATWYVHNWYLVNSNSGVPDGLLAPTGDGNAPMNMYDFWAWAAARLQEKVPGLYGLGNIFAGLGALAQQERARRGW